MDVLNLINLFPPSVKLIEVFYFLCDEKRYIWTYTTNDDEDNIRRLNKVFKNYNIYTFIFDDYPFKVKGIKSLILTKENDKNKIKKLVNSNLSIKELGELLGYPKCCCSFFEFMMINCKIKHPIRVIRKNSNLNKIYSFLLNDISLVYSIDFQNEEEKKLTSFINRNMVYTGILEPFILWHPCSYFCNESLKKVRKIYKFILKFFPNFAKFKKDLLAKTYILRKESPIILNDKEKYIKNDLIFVHYDSIYFLPKNFQDTNFIKKLSNFRKIIIKNGSIIYPKELKGDLALSFK